ncbi:unnamed protein product, partial [marine sediment metagenome]
QRSAADGDAGYGALGGATTDPHNDATAPEGTISNSGTVTATDGDHTDKVVLSLAGEATTDGAGRWYYCEVSATGATTQDTTHNRGYRTVGAITFQWQVDDGGGYDNIVGGTTDPYNYTDAPEGTISNSGTVTATSGVHTDKVVLSLAGEATTDGAAYDYQCVLDATGCAQQTSDNDDGYRTVGAITYQWQVDDGGGYDNIVGATTDPYNYTDAPAPAITPGNAVATDGAHTDKVALNLAGESIADGAAYDYQCMVSSVDASNTPLASDNDDGYRGHGVL